MLHAGIAAGCCFVHHPLRSDIAVQRKEVIR